MYLFNATSSYKLYKLVIGIHLEVTHIGIQNCDVREAFTLCRLREHLLRNLNVRRVEKNYETYSCSKKAFAQIQEETLL